MKTRRTYKFNFVLSDEEKRRLEALAKDQGRSAAGVLRHIIATAWKKAKGCVMTMGGAWLMINRQGGGGGPPPPWFWVAVGCIVVAGVGGIAWLVHSIPPMPPPPPGYERREAMP